MVLNFIKSVLTIRRENLANFTKIRKKKSTYASSIYRFCISVKTGDFPVFTELRDYESFKALQPEEGELAEFVVLEHVEGERVVQLGVLHSLGYDIRLCLRTRRGRGLWPIS